MENESCTSEFYTQNCKKRFDIIEEKTEKFGKGVTELKDKVKTLEKGVQELKENHQVFNTRFDNIDTSISLVSETVVGFKKKFFEGNGQEAYSIKIDRLEQENKRETWWKRLAITTLIGLSIFAIEETIRERMKKPSLPIPIENIE